MNRFRLVWIVLLTLACGLQAQTRFDYFYLEAEKSRLAEDFSSAAELYQHCLEIRPDAPEAIYNLGLIQFYLRQDSIGVQMLCRATELDPGNPWYLETLASVYLGQHNTDAAIPVLEKMSKLQSKRSDVLSQLASIYKSAGRSQDAIDALNRIELLEGKSAQLSMEKFSLYMDLKEKEKAYAELQSLCDEFPHDMNYKVMVGNQYQQAGDMDKAREIYDEVRRVEPENTHLQLSLLSLYEDTNQHDAYVHLRDSLLNDSTGSSEVRVALMRDYIDKAQKDSTQRDSMLQTFDRLLAKPQQNAQLLMLKAAYQMYSKAPEEETMKTMQRILDVDPGNDMALAQLLQYHGSHEDYPAMENIARIGVNHHPEEMGYAYYLGLSLYQQDRNQDAIDAFQQGLRSRTGEERPQLVSDLYSILGDLYYQQKRPEEAFAAYDSSLVYVDDNWACLNNYAYYLSLRGEQLEKAEEMSYRTVKAEPTNKTYLDTYAWILFIKKEYTQARIYIDRVVPPSATDDEILADEEITGGLLEHAGDIYWHCEQPQQALHLWQLAVKKGGAVSSLLGKKVKQKKYLSK